VECTDGTTANFAKGCLAVIVAIGGPYSFSLVVPITASLLVACTACPFHEHGRIVSHDTLSPERVVNALDEALKPMKFSRQACTSLGGANSLCDYDYAAPDFIGVGPTQVRFSLSDLSVQLIDSNRRESPLDHRVTDAIRRSVRARLDADIEFEKEKTSYKCVFGP
jgi:hypothetical protein